jgi:tetratricopeptide (TPR) repeat protein
LLGHIVLDRQDFEAARARFEEAQDLYRRIGDLPGQANCLASLGAVALAQSDTVSARRYYGAAIRLYELVFEHETIAQLHRRLADISEGEERAHYLAAARAAWERINRPDLIAALDREFTPPTPPAASPK